MTLKYLFHNKFGSFLSLLALSTGLACAFSAIFWIQYECSYDGYHRNIDALHRLLIVGQSRSDSGVREYCSNIIQQRVRLLKAIPEIKRIVRLLPERGKMRHKDTWIRENRFWLADPNVFDMLSMPLKQGNSRTALQRPNTIVITPAMASKYFGNADPMGKTLHFQFSLIPLQYNFTVTGILEPLPGNSSFQIDFLAHIPFAELATQRRQLSGTMSEWVYVMTFVELHKPSDLQSVQSRLTRLICHDAGKFNWLDAMNYRLEPLKHVYLHSKARFFFTPTSEMPVRKGNLGMLIFAAVMGGSGLLLACVNLVYCNVGKADSRPAKYDDYEQGGPRPKEVSQKKPIFHIRRVILAASLAMGGLVLLMPICGGALGHGLILYNISSPMSWILILSAITAAVILSYFVAVLAPIFQGRPVLPNGPRPLPNRWTTNAVFVFQTGLLITAATLVIMIYDAVGNFAKTDWGFNSRNLIFFQIEDAKLSEKYPVFKAEVLKIEGVEQVTASNYVPWDQGFLHRFAYYDDDAVVTAGTIFADTSFIETYGIPVMDGSDFKTKWTEMPGYMIINEAARHQLQRTGTDPLHKAVGIPMVGGLPISTTYWQNRVQGIIRNVDFSYPNASKGPLAIIPAYHFRYLRNYITIRLHDRESIQGMAGIKAVVGRFFPDSLFDYRYVTDENRNLYRQAVGSHLKVSLIVFGPALILTILGALGFTLTETNAHRKEIGIRKAFGARRSQIAIMLMIRFVKRICLAVLTAWPLSYGLVLWGDMLWGDSMPFNPSPWHSLVAAVFAFLVCIMTALSQAVRGAFLDPAELLKHRQT